MKKTALLTIALAFVFAGCSQHQTHARTADEYRSSIQASDEFKDIDAQLDQLEAQTNDITERYATVQKSILQNTDFGAIDESKVDKLEIYINENNVLIVNDAAMSRNDFSAYADRMLPKLCTPTPRLSIHKKADYDTAAWVLESLYSHGCMNISVE
ncbi:MAG: hypothetical protein IKY83_00205 [Proteobacteria bacterium]|nr:hypothetical protein [Pseudomonadota bacterium]